MALYTRIKICGITRVEDAVSVQQAGADAIGLVFYQNSPRYLGDFETASAIVRAVGPFVSVAALFVNATTEYVRAVLASVPIHLIQFHGSEDPAFCQQFNRPYIKAIAMRPDVDLKGEILRYDKAAGILLDTYKKDIAGGTGESFDWAQIPPQLPRPIVLAGGLSEQNVGDAIRQVKPYGVDTSSGVEVAAGIKSREKIDAFVAAVRMPAN